MRLSNQLLSLTLQVLQAAGDKERGWRSGDHEISIGGVRHLALRERAAL